jgi:aminopeptidase
MAALVGAADVLFYLQVQYRNPALLAEIPKEALQAHMRGRAPVQEITYDGRRRVVITDYPVRAQAAFFGVDFDRYHDAFWNAMDVDYDALRSRIRGLASFLAGKEKVRIRTPKGTDVTLGIKDRPVFLDAGDTDLPGEPNADVIANLPAGEACLAPWEDAADGTVVFDFAFIQGRRVEDLVVRFERGRARLESAAANFETARDYFAAGTGDPYVIAELGIGANPALTEPFGSILMDEKIAGTVHLALGDNRTMAGKNASSIHHDMLILRPEVTCDGALLMAEGELKI